MKYVKFRPNCGNPPSLIGPAVTHYNLFRFSPANIIKTDKKVLAARFYLLKCGGSLCTRNDGFMGAWQSYSS
jgi:hypothetical protein